MEQAVKEATSLFNYHPRFDLWGKNYVRENPSGSATTPPHLKFDQPPYRSLRFLYTSTTLVAYVYVVM